MILKIQNYYHTRQIMTMNFMIPASDSVILIPI